MITNLTVAEYFAGIGLMRLGLGLGGWTTVFANDIDADKREMYEHHFGRSPAVLPDDIHLLNVTDVPPTMLATASFPCNDLSLAGARKGLAGQHSSAFWGFIRILEEMGARRPPLILLENVTGFLSSHDGADFREALLALNRLGYRCAMELAVPACFAHAHNSAYRVNRGSFAELLRLVEQAAV